MAIRQFIRSLIKDPLNTSVIIISLALGMGCTNPILLFINRELSTDSFQKNADRIYLLKCDDPFNKGSKMFGCRIGAAEYMKENFGEVEDFCRIKSTNVPKIVANGMTFYDKPILYEASSNFFRFFTYMLLADNANSVLETKDDIVISEKIAIEYFGSYSPVGQRITLINGKTKKDYLIKGVFRKPTANTQLSFDMVSFGSETESFAFLLLKEKADAASLEKIFEKEKERIPSINDGTPGRYYLESLKQAYFDTTQNGPLGPIRDKSHIWIALVILIMIIAVAAFNYLGLINNKLLDKSLEFHIRRINGASKARLIAGFMLENLIIVLIAFALSLGLIAWIRPFFNELVRSNIEFLYFIQTNELLLMAGLILFLLLITFLFSLSRINNQGISITRKTWSPNQKKIFRIPIFNVLQLAVTLILLVCTFFIYKQIRYIINKDIGLDKEVVEVKLPFEYKDKTTVFREEILKNPSIALVSITPASPLLEYWIELLHYTEDGADKQYSPYIFSGDENFINTLGIELIDGRNFSGNIASDHHNCMINESFAQKFSGQNLIGTKIPGDNEMTVIGIIKDFHYSSLKDKIAPSLIRFDNSGNHLLVKPYAGRLQAARHIINETWQKLIPDYPVNIESVRERFEWYHRENTNYAKLIGSCCLMSLFLSMIGLFAISFNSIRKRRKEIAIRKINGATTMEIIFLLNKDFIKLVVFAFILAAPIAWYSMHRWLQYFAYKTELSWWIFAIAGFLALGITLLTVSWQCAIAASRNPVEALRYE
jgi:putative ABC transport system permease protein